MGPTNNKAHVGNRDASREVATVSVVGDVDRAGLESCDYLLSKAGESISGAVIDLSGATHVDYRATAILVARRRVFKARGGELAVAAGRTDIRNIVRASAGAEIPVFATVGEALAYVRGEADLISASSSSKLRRSRGSKMVSPD
jgi:anti-anti-sigma regulatory factor